MSKETLKFVAARASRLPVKGWFDELSATPDAAIGCVWTLRLVSLGAEVPCYVNLKGVFPHRAKGATQAPHPGHSRIDLSTVVPGFTRFSDQESDSAFYIPSDEEKEEVNRLISEKRVTAFNLQVGGRPNAVLNLWGSCFPEVAEIPVDLLALGGIARAKSTEIIRDSRDRLLVGTFFAKGDSEFEVVLPEESRTWDNSWWTGVYHHAERRSGMPVEGVDLGGSLPLERLPFTKTQRDAASTFAAMREAVAEEEAKELFDFHKWRSEQKM